MMRVFMAILCSLLAVCSVSARDSCQKGTDGQASIYRLPPFERAVRCTKYFDYDKLNKLLDIRFKNVEDRIVVSESGNTKKLKKELTDRKIPASHRDEILLVCDNNRVLWACGVRRCEDCRVTGSTKNVFKIQLILKERN